MKIKANSWNKLQKMNLCQLLTYHNDVWPDILIYTYVPMSVTIILEHKT